jgi:dephospho-CoA kinase
VARVTASRGLRPDEVARRIDAQMPNEERCQHADVVIENDGTLAGLRARVDAAWLALGRTAR